MTSLNGKLCLITGASSGIGEAIARRFARQGAQLCLVARSEERLARLAGELGAGAITARADVTKEGEVRGAVEAASRLGPIDVLVNSAGAVYFDPVGETSEEHWDDVLDSNLKGTFLFCKHVIPGMLERGRGDIVNIGSIASHQGFENSAAYCAAKHGVLGLSRALSLEVRKQGLRVITVSPGSVDTPLWDPMEWTPDRSKMLHPDEVAESVHAALTISATAAIDELLVMPLEGVL